MKKSILTLLLLTLLPFGSAYAATPVITPPDGNDTVTITVENAASDKYSFSVMKGVASLSDYDTLTDISDVCVWAEELSPDNSGTLTATFKYKHSGEYTYYLVSADESFSDKLELVAAEAIVTSLTALNSWQDTNSDGTDDTTGKTFAEAVASEASNLGINTALLASIGSGKAEAEILAKISAEPLDTTDFGSSVKRVNAIIDATAMWSGISVAQNEEVYGLIDGTTLGWAKNEAVTDTMHKNAAASTTGTYSTLDEYMLGLKQNLILEILATPSGTENFRQVCRDYPETGINEANYNDYQINQVIGTRYANYQAVKTALDNAPTGGTVSTGTGSSGGSSSGGGGFVVSPPAPAKPAEALKTFTDVGDGDWFYKPIVALATKGILSGTDENKYEPYDNVTRSGFATMLVNAAGYTLVGYEDIFSDINDGEWYTPFVLTAYKNGIVTGRTDGSFGRSDNITRQDMAVMIYKVIKDKDVKTEDKEQFADYDTIADYAGTAVEFLQKAGVVSGKGENNFDPQGFATRAEAAAMIYNILDYIG